MYDGMQYDPIQGQGQGHEPLKVRNPSIFESYVLCHFLYVLYCIVVLVTVISCFIWLFGHFGRRVDQ